MTVTPPYSGDQNVRRITEGQTVLADSRMMRALFPAQIPTPCVRSMGARQQIREALIALAAGLAFALAMAGIIALGAVVL